MWFIDLEEDRVDFVLLSVIFDGEFDSREVDLEYMDILLTYS